VVLGYQTCIGFGRITPVSVMLSWRILVGGFLHA
jgi:hypothetical protein